MSADLSTIITSTQIDLAIAGWLHASLQHSGSNRTVKVYADLLRQFRAMLHTKGLELDRLDAAPQPCYDGLSERQVVTLFAQEFAASSARGKTVRASTHNQRLAVLSSFYEYAINHDFLAYNPIRRVGRAKVQPYGSSKALPPEQTAQGLASIDRKTQRGKRDYALISVLLATGRRLSEVAGLQWRDLYISRQGVITLNFQNLKGGKEISDKLDSATSQALLDWLGSYYGEHLSGIATDAPLWVSLAAGGHGHKRSYGQPLSIRGISDICKKYLGTGKVHTTRHTWTHNMLAEGADLPLIQQKLGHASLATTGIYTQALQSSENPFVERIAKRAGIE